MKRILVTGVGGPTPRAFVRAVKWHGGETANEFEFIGVDCNPYCSGLYDYTLFSKTFLIPPASHKDYWKTINNVIGENEIDGAIVLPELEVLEWSKNHSNLTRKIALHLPDYKLAEKLYNKYTLHKSLEHSDYIPKYFLINPAEYSYEEITSKTGNTFWVRATEGTSGLASLKINSKKVLSEWFLINSHIKEFLASEYLPGRNLTCKLLFFNGRLLRTACAERIQYVMSKSSPSGITGNTSFGKLINEQALVDISKNAIEEIASGVNCLPHGMFTVDLKEDSKGTPKITEINIRHIAFTLVFAAAGANIPLDTLTALFFKNPEEMDLIHYEFPQKTIFFRDVDTYPVLMNESEIKTILS